MSTLKINAHVCIYFLPVVNVAKCVELTITECNLDGFLGIRVEKSR